MPEMPISSQEIINEAREISGKNCDQIDIHLEHMREEGKFLLDPRGRDPFQKRKGLIS